MPKLGILLTCEHYPAVSADPAKIDAQLRLWLAEFGMTYDDVAVFAAYAGELPPHAGVCDAWIVSGTLLAQCDDTDFAIRRFLRAAVALGRPIFAIHHAEHLVHEAVAGIGAPRPTTPQHIRMIRNPFRSFLGRDTLHRFNPGTRAVEALERPLALRPRGLFGAMLKAA